MATNPVTDGVTTGRTVFDFALDVWDRVLRGLCLWGVNKREEGRPDRELKEKLGEWADEAKDSSGRWQQPVLTKDNFQRHFETLKLETEARRPLGECTSSFNWAKLLYALCIRPKQGREDGIITWRKIPDDEADPGNISLVIHSSALWHIINLYQINTGLTSLEAELFQFEFGKLEVKDGGPGRLYSFESLGNVNPREIPQFFPYRLRDSNGPRDGHLFSERRLAVDSYLGALRHGNSNDRLNLNDTAQPLARRVEVLLEAMDLMNERDWSKPYLITQSWIDLATRINRRATTDGGKDSLQRHIVEFIAKDDSVVKSLKKPLRNEDTWKRLLQTLIRERFMFHDGENPEKYEFIWNLRMQLSSAENPQFKTIVNNQLLRSLEALPETADGRTWLRTATESLPAETLLRVLNTPHKILNQPVVIIHHIPDQWDFLGRIID
ncbi:hypothetical protein IFR05_008438 [Cadophora sp. M221]|nr:hypothetical protein IFR05_008438 [Cadophora sp. M221]